MSDTTLARFNCTGEILPANILIPGYIKLMCDEEGKYLRPSANNHPQND
jgi:hypothetical protein